MKITELTNIDETEKRLLKGIFLRIYLFIPAFIVELLASISLVLLLQKKN